MNSRLVCGLAFVFLLAPLVAQGSTLMEGQTIEAWYLYPTIGTIYSGPLTAVVGSGVEFPGTLHSAMNLDISDTNLYSTFNWRVNGPPLPSAASTFLM